MKLHFSHQYQEVNIIKIQKNKINFAREIKQFSKKNQYSGAVSSFLGKARKFSEEREIKHLYIENYQKMNEFQLKQIVKIVKKHWKIDDCLIIHRFGKILVGEDIVLILVASKHRKDSIESIEYIIDWLKIKATFWKKEVTKDGEFWVNQKKSDILKAKKHNFSIG